MENSLCLNCGAEISLQFCPKCGQKATTHRITLKHFIMHDMLHGVWHLERGILYTLKEALIRPGQAALDYISGKRIRYYNIFYLCLLIIGLNIVLRHWDIESVPEAEPRKIDPKESTAVEDFFNHYIRFILLGIVPLLAISARLVFRRLKLNLAEHFILSGFGLLAMLIISVPIFTLNFFNRMFDFPNFVDFIGMSAVFLILFFPCWVYLNATKGLYTILGFLYRIVLFYIVFFFTMIIALTLLAYIVSGGQTDIIIH